ncbi:hypothetical protein HD806DRAFT_511955 [Xylariaceae sp. AK1471]|nr:hypothetical protein HD806DRAFT_511955 [Xylariaceae sp. AK1471]
MNPRCVPPVHSPSFVTAGVPVQTVRRSYLGQGLVETRACFALIIFIIASARFVFCVGPFSLLAEGLESSSHSVEYLDLAPSLLANISSSMLCISFRCMAKCFVVWAIRCLGGGTRYRVHAPGSLPISLSSEFLIVSPSRLLPVVSSPFYFAS